MRNICLIDKACRIFKPEHIADDIIRNISIVYRRVKLAVNRIIARAVDYIYSLFHGFLERVYQDLIALESVSQLVHQVFRKPYPLNKVQRILGVLGVVICEGAVEIGIHNRKRPDCIGVHFPYLFKPV